MNIHGIDFNVPPGLCVEDNVIFITHSDARVAMPAVRDSLND